jgi:hypothetical protein
LVLFGNIICIYVEPSNIFTQTYILFPNGQLFHVNILFVNLGRT